MSSSQESHRVNIKLHPETLDLDKTDERDRFRKFTAEARWGLIRAEANAQAMRHSLVDTAHLLIGLGEARSSNAYVVLRHYRFDSSYFRAFAARTIPTIEAKVDRPTAITANLKTVILESVQEARAFRHKYVASEHMLTAILKHGDELVLDYLVSLGLTTSSIVSGLQSPELTPLSLRAPQADA